MFRNPKITSSTLVKGMLIFLFWVAIVWDGGTRSKLLCAFGI